MIMLEQTLERIFAYIGVFAVMWVFVKLWCKWFENGGE